MSTAQTGSVTVTPLGGPFNAVVGNGAEFGFCVGPNLDNCSSSGLSASVDISATQVAVTFFGGTFPATGTFVIQLSGFNVPITGATLASGSLSSGSFAITGQTSNSITFTGSVNGGAFAAVGGRTLVFNVTTGTPPPPVPPPSTLVLLLAGISIVGMWHVFRRNRAHV